MALGDRRTRRVARNASYIGLGAYAIGRKLIDSRTTAQYNRMIRAAELSGQAYNLPVKIGRQGHIVATVTAWTSSYFRGDTGFDIWFEPSTADTSYAQMQNGGNASTEIMIWLNHPGLRTQSSNLRYYRTQIDGRWWQVEVGMASAGHGHTASHPHGWTVVNFIAPQYQNGNVTVHNLVLNAFASYAISHGWLRASDYWMGINEGFEFTRGSATAAPAFAAARFPR